VAESLAESFSRTAPFYLKPFIFVRRRALEPALRAPGEALRLLRGAAAGEMAERAESIKRDLQQGATTPLEMAQHLSVWSSAVGTYRAPEAWRPDAEQILRRMREEERSNLEPAQWDDLTREIWAEAPKLRANLKVVGALVAAVVTMALLPLDPTGALWAVTLKELLGVIGAGGAMAAVSERQLEQGNFQVLAQRQFESLLAIACDQVGLPRASDEASLGDIPTRLNRQSLGVAERGWRLMEIEGEELARAAAAAEGFTA